MESWMAELPDDIIHRILTNYVLCNPTLTNKNAVRLSLLSKELSRAVRRRPALYFEWSSDPRCLQELKYMLSTLKQNTHLQTFIIQHAQGSYNPETTFDDYSSFDRCIELAATNSRGLRNLKLWMLRSYVLPQAIFQVESLVWLDLGRCRLGPAESIITWPSLKRLHLYFVNIGEGVFDYIIRGCPFIEILEILHCTFNNLYFHIKVSNLSYLKHLGIWLTDSQTVEVDASPTLESYSYTDGSIAYQLIDLGKKEYHKLKSLSLHNPNVLSEDFLINIEHQFPGLEDLYIYNTNIKRIKISSFSLKKIYLKVTPGLEEATFDVPNIERFDFQSDHIPKLSFAGNSGGWISLIAFEVCNAKIDTSWFLKLKEFLAASKTKEIWITFKEGVTKFSIQAHPQMYADSVRLPGAIQELVMWRLWYEPETHLAMEILDGILSICRPQSIWLQDWHESELPKLLYDRLMGLTRINDPNFQHHVIEIGCRTELVEGSTKYRRQALKHPQVRDKNKFLELFKVDHDDLKAIFDVVFNLEYFWRPKHNMITSDAATTSTFKDSMAPRVLQRQPCNDEQHIDNTDDTHCGLATSVKQGTLKEVKDSMEPQILPQVSQGFSAATDSMQPCNDFASITKLVCRPNKTNERHCRTPNSVNEGKSSRSHKLYWFHFPNCKPLRSVKRWLFN